MSYKDIEGMINAISLGQNVYTIANGTKLILKKMKIIKGNLINRYLLFLVFVNVLLLSLVINKKFGFVQELILLLFINLINYLGSQNSLHFFSHNDKKLIIKNLWNPFKYIEFPIENIESIQVKVKSLMGHLVEVSTSSGKFKYIANQIPMDELDNFVDDIKQLIEKINKVTPS